MPYQSLDTILMCIDGKLRAHSHLLSKASPILATMLRASYDARREFSIIFPDVRVCIMRYFARYLQYGELPSTGTTSIDGISIIDIVDLIRLLETYVVRDKFTQITDILNTMASNCTNATYLLSKCKAHEAIFAPACRISRLYVLDWLSGGRCRAMCAQCNACIKLPCLECRWATQDSLVCTNGHSLYEQTYPHLTKQGVPCSNNMPALVWCGAEAGTIPDAALGGVIRDLCGIKATPSESVKTYVWH